MIFSCGREDRTGKMWFLSALLLLTLAHSGTPSDEITYLPGLVKQPSFKHYSGYLQASGTKKLHFWLLESQSSPVHDPLVLWLSGGPGCSSLYALLMQNGPFRIQDDGFSVNYNDYSWNKEANVLYLESPAGVGFSYSDDQNYTTNDDEVAEDNYLALKDFFKRYPYYKGHSFFITGSSYAGYYVPMLALKVMQDSGINFQGIAVGNGLSSMQLNGNSLVYFTYYHGLIGDDLWADLTQSCCPNNNSINAHSCNFYNNTNPDCATAMEQVSHVIKDIGLNRYNLFANCSGGIPPHSGLGFDGQKYVTYDVDPPVFHNYYFGQKRRMKLKDIPSHKLRAQIPCVNTSAITAYLNNPYVRQSLHIPDNITSWEVCSSAVLQNYTFQYDTMKSQYDQIIMAFKYRVLLYNGDTDMACNFLGNQWFVESLGLQEQIQRRAWLFNNGKDQIAGFVKEYQNFAFLTVKGAGHMVPTDKPNPAFTMINNFLKKRPFFS
ncbi:CTSA [Branchiostoma lanceolatum]|uniref:CTSA protein n=3 Tax=Branchiostoma lanceolatum TaxID=7740 RepID=A0A8K0EXW9_BRALA|nr:CTSA [Branchiostoma lanceolatum]